ncbi:MAG: Gfo/Idh/MocA family protein [Acidobacteriota bacterium]
MKRREFLPVSGAALAATILPRHVLGGSGGRAPSDKLNIAAVGVGGMGANYIKGCESENIVAMADVDDAVAAHTFKAYPAAKTYRDYRVMLEKEKGIDAVIIGTPDHTHATVAMAAMKLGKHVYCAKPLTRTIREARLLAATAKEHRLATQMSVQSCASDDALNTVEWVQSGVIGPVREVHVWSDRPVWPQALERPKEKVAVPSSLDWDLWLGPAPVRPYHPVYHPFSWRGWVDFGTGALGDMACHSFHVIFQALKLGAATSVSASAAQLRELMIEGGGWARSRVLETPETYPAASIVTWEFPARGDLPPVRMTWYDGGLKPPRPSDLEPSVPLESDGILFIGEKGTILSGFSGGPSLVPTSRNAGFTPPPKTLPRSIGHYVEWIAAAKGGKPANCEFGFGSLLTETALLGVIAQRTGKYLTWDAPSMRITNDADANALVAGSYRAGWCV